MQKKNGINSLLTNVGQTNDGSKLTDIFSLVTFLAYQYNDSGSPWNICNCFWGEKNQEKFNKWWAAFQIPFTLIESKDLTIDVLFSRTLPSITFLAKLLLIAAGITFTQ